MADSIVRLQLDSQNYDANIKRATDGLMKYEEECRKVGGTLEVVEKETLDYVKALGEMQTKSKTTKGQIGELTKGYTELGMQYKRLTDAEKQSPYGQAMAKSLDQLKGRIQETRKGLKEVEESLKDVEEEAGGGGLGGKLDELAGKFGLNIQQLTSWGAAVGIATGALKVFKDAFRQNEVAMDWWEGTIEAAQSTYEGFLNSLNNGDASGFFRNIDNIINSAYAAYNALDTLGTFNAFNQMAITGKKADFNQALADYRTGDISKEGAEAKGKELKDLLYERKKYEQTAYRNAIDALAREHSIDPVLLRRIFETSDWEYLQEIQGRPMTGREIKTHGLSAWGTTFSKEVTAPANEYEELGEKMRKIRDADIDRIQKLGKSAADTDLEISGVNRQMVRLLGGRTTAVSPVVGPAPSLIGGAVGALPYMPAGFDFGGAGLALLQRNMAGGLGNVQGYREEKKPVDPEKQLEAFDGMIGGLESVAGGLEAMGIELPEGVSKLLNGIGGLITVIQGISAVIVATQAILEMNTAAQFIPFAHGGVVRAANGWVGGNSWSGDRVPALLNSGELVLNRAQQGNLASQLSGAGWQNLRLETEISGTNLRIVLNNESRSRGRGVYVTR